MSVSIRNKGKTDELVRMTRPYGRRIQGVMDTRGAHAYALGYCGMVGWKTKILMELSTPLTVVVTSAWDSLISIVAGEVSRYVVSIQPDLLWNCATTVSVGGWPEVRMLRCRCGSPAVGTLWWGIPAWGTGDVTIDLLKMDRVVSFRAEVEQALTTQ